MATNVAAACIHVDNLDLVVNVDPPRDHKDYLFGRPFKCAGESGSVVTLVTSGQRRDMTRLMASAGITPQVTPVRSGEAELSRITGAQAPSGVPVVIAVPVVERPRRARVRRGFLVPWPPQPLRAGPHRPGVRHPAEPLRPGRGT